MSCCQICGRLLDNPDDPFSRDCGGDCLYCMATVAEDPDCIAAVEELTRSRTLQTSSQIMPAATRVPLQG
jgi:hypothetical protein